MPIKPHKIRGFSPNRLVKNLICHRFATPILKVDFEYKNRAEPLNLRVSPV